MDLLFFQSVSLNPDSGIGHICEQLNSVIGHGIWYDTYQIQNTDMLWFVKGIIETVNSDNTLCGCFGLYPSYIAGVLNRMPGIHFYVVCSEKINVEEYIRKCMADKECTITHIGGRFLISYQEKVIKVWFEQRVVSGKLLSELTFAYNILGNIRLSSLAYGIVCVNKRVTYITNEVLTSRHDCLSHMYGNKLHAAKILANCKEYPIRCIKHPYRKWPVGTLFCSKRSHRLYCDPKNPCQCRLCVKVAPPSLKSLCVNRIASSTLFVN
jgi:hypothetical protein